MDKMDILLEANRISETLALETGRFIAGCLPRELPRKQHLCLLYLGNEGSVPSGKLAEVLDISKSSLSQLLSRLEKSDLAKRTINPENRKAISVALASEGIKYYEDFRKAKETVLKHLFEGLTLKEAEEMLKLNSKALAVVRGSINETKRGE